MKAGSRAQVPRHRRIEDRWHVGKNRYHHCREVASVRSLYQLIAASCFCVGSSWMIPGGARLCANERASGSAPRVVRASFAAGVVDLELTGEQPGSPFLGKGTSS
jgi:hypothetical protein